MSASKTIDVDGLRPVLEAYGRFEKYQTIIAAITQKIDELPPAPAMVRVVVRSANWEPDPAAGWLCGRCLKWHVARENYCCGCGAKMEGKQ